MRRRPIFLLERCEKPCSLVFGIEALTVESYTSLSGTTQCSIDMAGARYEPVKLERQKCSIAFATALMGGSARQHQECLQL
jgi:hypothetical protein